MLLPGCGPGSVGPKACGCEVISRMRESIIAMVALTMFYGAFPAMAQVEKIPLDAFGFSQSVLLPVTPDHAYDYFSGDVSGWWDHSFTENPHKLAIEARPGGAFIELFDDQGNGAQHAVVILADRGRRLVLRGPLGLSGNALDMVFSFEFRPDPGGTLLLMQARAAGQMNPDWPTAVADVWRHFLVERLLPFAQKDCLERAICVKSP